MTELYSFDNRILVEDAINLCCQSSSSRAASNTIRYCNPLTILAHKWNIQTAIVFNYLKFGIDKSAKLRRKILRKSWIEEMGLERANERKQKQSERQKGKKHSQSCLDKVKAWYANKNNMAAFKAKIHKNIESNAIKQSITMKNRILNGDYVPFGNGGHRQAHISYYDGFMFRSRFEIIYYAYNKYIKHHDVEFETVRIKYHDENDEERIYIADFYNKTTNTIVEVKPSNLIMQEMKYKLKGVASYIKESNISYKVVTEKKLKTYLKELYNIDIHDNILDDVYRKYKSWIK